MMLPSAGRRRQRCFTFPKLMTAIIIILSFVYVTQVAFISTAVSTGPTANKEMSLVEKSSLPTRRKSARKSKSSWVVKKKQKQQKKRPDVTPIQNHTDFHSICWSLDCIRERAQSLARPFSYKSRSSWCLPPQQTTTTTSAAAAAAAAASSETTTASPAAAAGLLLVKIPKSASSTAAGVTLRLAHRYDCATPHWQHRPGHEYAHRTADRSFLWTTVRNPAQRAMSTLYFHVVSRRNQTVATDDDVVLKHLKRNDHVHQGTRSKGKGWGFQVQYAAMEALQAASPGDLQQVELVVRDILEKYDFILLTERTEESLVAMAILMGVTVGDVLVTSSKVAGHHYHLVHYGHGVFKCLPTIPAPSKMSPAIESYLDSDQWRALSYGDYLLHAAVNASLDATIDKIGRAKFEAELQEFQRLKRLEAQQCAPLVRFPCSTTGVPQESSCYLKYYDFGCGYNCIDDLLSKDKDDKV